MVIFGTYRTTQEQDENQSGTTSHIYVTTTLVLVLPVASVILIADIVVHPVHSWVLPSQRVGGAGMAMLSMMRMLKLAIKHRPPSTHTLDTYIPYHTIPYYHRAHLWSKYCFKVPSTLASPRKKKLGNTILVKLKLWELDSI